MRSVVQEWLASREVTLLHPDIWPYTGPTVINCGVAEQALTAVALGLAEHKSVALYGIAGFILLKSAEILKLYTPKHAVIIFNAGANGCYPKELGIGHQIDYDFDLCRLLGVKLHRSPSGSTRYEIRQPLFNLLDSIKDDTGWHLVRLGFDLPEAPKHPRSSRTSTCHQH